MGFRQQTRRFTTTFSEGPQSLVDDMNDYFSTRRLVYQNGDMVVPESTAYAGAFSIRLVYGRITGSDDAEHGLLLEARLFKTDQFIGGQTAQEKFNAVFEAGEALVPVDLFDVTNPHTNESTGDEILAIFAITDRDSPFADGMAGDGRSVYIAQADQNIPGNLTRRALLFDVVGEQLDDNIRMENMDLNTQWDNGERSFAVYDIATGAYVGCPSCLGTAALVTETPPPPPPPPVDCPFIEQVSQTPVQQVLR